MAFIFNPIELSGQAICEEFDDIPCVASGITLNFEQGDKLGLPKCKNDEEGLIHHFSLSPFVLPIVERDGFFHEGYYFVPDTLFFVMAISNSYSIDNLEFIPEVGEEVFFEKIDLIDSYLSVESTYPYQSVPMNIYVYRVIYNGYVDDNCEIYLGGNYEFDIFRETLFIGAWSPHETVEFNLHIGRLLDNSDETLYTFNNFINLPFACGEYELEPLNHLGHFVHAENGCGVVRSCPIVRISNLVLPLLYNPNLFYDLLPEPFEACNIHCNAYQQAFNLYLDRTLLIDIDYCFKSCPQQKVTWDSPFDGPYVPRTIYMGPDAKIIIESGNSLTLERTIILSCDTLWNSIVVEEGATLNIRDSYIRDGIQAVHVKPGGTINIDGNIFDANMYGIYSPPSGDGSQYEIFQGPFYGNEFVNRNGLKAFPEGYTEVTSEGPAAAVHLNDVKSFIAHGVGPNDEIRKNTIDSVPFGFWMRNTGLFMQNYQIKNAFQESWYGGTAIVLDNKNMGTRSEIVGSGSPSEPDIYNAEFVGIALFNGTNRLLDNNISEVPMGVRMLNSQMAINFISNNLISASQYGILHALERGGINRIIENTIEMQSDISNQSQHYSDVIGIYMEGFGISSQTRIMDNEILMRDNSRIGMNVNSVPSIRIRGNEVYDMITGLVGFQGLHLIGSPNALVDYNLFYGATVTDSRGMLVADNPTSRINCNTYQNLISGLVVYSENTMTEIKGSNFTGTLANALCYGICNVSNLTSPTHITGPQEHHGNLWLGSSSWGAWHTNPLGIAEESRYTVNPTANPNYTTNRNPHDWFVDDLTGTAWTCPEDRPESDWYDFTPKTEPTELDLKIATEARPFEDHNYEQSLTYIARRSLYDRIMDGYYDSAVLAGAGISGFVNHADTSNLGLFYHARKTIGQAVRLPAAAINQLESKSEEIGLSIRSLISLDSIAWLDTANVDTAQWLLDRQLIVDDIHDKTDELNDIYESYASEITDPSASLITALSEVSTTTLPEYAEKEMLLIIVDHVFGGDFDFNTSEESTIIEIAGYCPAVAGPSVHWARNLRRTFEPDVVYDDENCGTGSSSRIVNPQLAEDETTVELFPNPSTDYLNVLISKNPYQTYAIYDQLGRMVLKGFIMEQSDLIRISTEALSQGQYILRLKGEESESSHQFIKADK